MTDFIDYYRILQVHSIAEPEVIEGAYKKLCKKYHPDICKQADAEEKMKMINQAYEILGDSLNRKEYDNAYNAYQNKSDTLNHSSSQNRENKAHFTDRNAAEKLLEEYFSCISRGAYEKAYLYISDYDKNHIRYSEFAEWQRAVAALYEIVSFRFTFNETVNFKDSIFRKFDNAFDFDVSIIEIDIRSGKPLSNELQRYIVLENNVLKLYLGYTKVKELTGKLKELANESKENSEAYYDKSEILREIKREIARSTRYSRPFSLVVFEVTNKEDFKIGNQFSEFIDKAHYTKRLLIRNTDFHGRWSNTRFFLLLPETRIHGARKTAEKLMDALRRESVFPDLKFCASVNQYKNYDIQEFIDISLAGVISARKKGPWTIVY